MSDVEKNITEKVYDSEKVVRRLLREIDNSNFNWHQIPMLDMQTHVLNFKLSRLRNKTGFRVLILRRNLFEDKFARRLASILTKDNYIREIDITGNQITDHGLKVLMKIGVLWNTTLLKIDARLNPGCTSKLQR